MPPVPRITTPPPAVPDDNCLSDGGCSVRFDRKTGELTFRPLVPPVEDGSASVLQLTTPWGTTSRATRSRERQVSWWTFELDFTTEIEVDNPAAAQVVAERWVIDVPGGSGGPPIATWTPRGDDLSATIALIAAAQDRVVKGSSPSVLATNGLVFVPSQLTSGRSAVATVEVENSGGSTARDVVVTTRCSIVALHNLRFALGNIRPGKRKTQTVSVAIPPNVGGQSVTLVVGVEEKDGPGVRPITQTMTIAGTAIPCPEGRFSRERYDTKRSKLLKALTDGSITQAEFDSYDAELVRCLD